MDFKMAYDPIWDWSWWFCLDCLQSAEIISIGKNTALITCPICGDKKTVTRNEAEFYKARMKNQ